MARGFDDENKSASPMKRLAYLNTYECLWLYVLRILADAPVHAYALRKMIDGRFGFMPGMVSAYKVLYLLEHEGYVRSRESGRVTNYEITHEGKKILGAAWRFYERQARILQ